MISRHHVPHRKTAPWETKQGHSRDHHQPGHELPRDSFTTKTADKNLIKPTKTCILLTQIGTYSMQNWVNFGFANYQAESWYAIPTYCKGTPDLSRAPPLSCQQQASQAQVAMQYVAAVEVVHGQQSLQPQQPQPGDDGTMEPATSSTWLVSLRSDMCIWSCTTCTVHVQ